MVMPDRYLMEIRRRQNDVADVRQTVIDNFIVLGESDNPDPDSIGFQ